MGNLLLLGVLDGLAYAALVFLVAVGLNLIFGVSRVLNVAHGALYAFGGYAAASLVGAIFNSAMPSAPAWLSIPLLFAAAAIVGIVLGFIIEVGLVRRTYRVEPVLQLLVTFAVFMILQDVQRSIWGTQPVFEHRPVDALGTIRVGTVPYTAYQLVFLPVVAAATFLSLRWFLRGTLLGKKISAVTENREVAEAIGIDAGRVSLVTFIVASALAALGGALALPITSLVPEAGTDMIVLSFAVVAIAGLGRIDGALIAAVLLGIARSIAVYLYPNFDVVTPYIVMVAVLLFRPQGLFGQVEPRRI